MAKKITKEQVIGLLKKRQGDRPANQLAKELGVTPQYLSDIFSGRREIGPSILIGLGLEKETFFVEAK